MRVPRSFMHAAAGAVLSLAASAAAAADHPAPKEGTFVAKDFRFHTGEVLPEVRLHYRTIGEPSGEPVMVLHGTGGSGASMLTPAFAGELFGDGQPLDAKKYFIILPDAVGHGKSTKPSDGLKAKFPKYNSEDMVDGQYRLLTEGLGLKHVRLVIGNSMGGMHTFLWGGKYPDYMDALVPMASQPTEMAARNWMMRRLMIETIRQDPAYNNGEYAEQPKSMKLANVLYSTGTNGGTLAYQKLAPTREKADKMVDERLATPFNADANDFIYAWESSGGYNPTVSLPHHGSVLLQLSRAILQGGPLQRGRINRHEQSF
jgi:homoserine O-acetyltransferase/O-succinyltransferase